MRTMLIFAFLIAAASAAPLTYETFWSPSISLKSGQISNTPGNWGPLPFVNGAQAVRFFKAVLVYADAPNVTVPAEEVYVHHWLIYNGAYNGGLCANLPNIWGIGAELEQTWYEYPEGFAFLTTGTEVWTANVHLIRTTNVPDIQMCIECHCSDSILPDHPKGGVACCPDRAQCWGMENSTLSDAKSYQLKYIVGYEPITAAIQPLTIFSLDATAQASYDCHIEYQIPQLAANETHTLQSFTTLPNDWQIVTMNSHLHIGGLSFSIDHFSQGVLVKSLCTSEPTYAASGYITGIPACSIQAPYLVKKGDQLRLTSVYGARTLTTGGHSWHEGVMGLVFVAAVALPDPDLSCREMLYRVCGPPPYGSTYGCESCAKAAWSYLVAAQCTADLVDKECAKTSGGGNIPAPDSVHGMQLHVASIPTGLYMNMTGPVGGWFAVGYNPTEALMDGAVAYVYTLNAQGAPCLQQYKLGNHFAGSLLDANYPATFTTVGGTVIAEFNVTSLSLPSYAFRLMGHSGGHDMDASVQAASQCFLFAQGTSMTLGYHGSTRGFTCLQQAHGPSEFTYPY